MTVEEDVDKEDDVDDAVGSQLGDIVDRLALECGIVWDHDGRVVGKHEDQPVPRTAELGIVQYYVFRSDRNGRAVLRHCQLSVERQLKYHQPHHSVCFSHIRQYDHRQFQQGIGV